MRKNIFKRVFTAVTTLAFVLGMSVAAFAAEDDIVLNDPAGSPMIKTWDSGDGTGYTYLGWVAVGSTSADYKYLQITYTGDATALENIRMEFMKNDGSEGGLKDKTCWVRTNDEGTILTTENKELAAPSATAQTAILDLGKMGLDLSTGIQGFHIHGEKGQGSFTITDARLIKSLPAAESDKGTEDTDKKADVGSGDTNALPGIIALLAGAAAVAAVTTATSKKAKFEK